MGFLDRILGRRDAVAAPVRMIGFPSDGGLTYGGVTASTSLGLSSVWRCLDILSNGVSQLPWRELMGNLELPPSSLVDRPQAARTRREWTSLVVSTLALYDVCYLLKAGGYDGEGVPVSLMWLDPGQVMPTTTIDPVTILSGLPSPEYWVGQTRVQRDDLVILHRSPQPGVSDTMGGVLQLARASFAGYLAADRYASRYWQAGGSPTTVLETEAALNDTQAQGLSDRWSEKRAKGPDHAPVLSSGVKARSFGADPTTESATGARREMVADVGRYFGVPTRILNAPTGDTETYATSESANQDLVRYTLQNYIGAIEDAVTDQLPRGRRLEIDTRVLTLGTQLAQAQAYQLAGGAVAWMDDNEIREAWRLPPREKAPAAPAPVPAGGLARV